MTLGVYTLCRVALATCLVVAVFPFVNGTITRSSGAIRDGRGGTSSPRIAIIIPFIGKGPENIPSYLELFCIAAAGSASLVDFLIFHNGVLDGFYSSECPSNVRFVSLGSLEKMSSILLRVADQVKDEDLALKSRDQLTNILTKFIGKYPYALVEFKPAMGHIFAKYLEGYSHWGYSDLDIIFGDLGRWITPEELADFDIVTYGFGDQNRLYLRGQFTFHKNDNKINQLWRGCDYLSRTDVRFSEVMSGEKFNFESAEGCYSTVILKRNDIKVKYAVKAFTDVDKSDSAYSSGLFVDLGKRHDRTVVYKAGSRKDEGRFLLNYDTLFDGRTNPYNRPSQPLQWDIGEREIIPDHARDKGGCGMYWMHEKYKSQLCITGTEVTESVYWINGKLFKQRYETLQLKDGVESAPFFHFQEWKRSFRDAQLSTFSRLNTATTYVISKEGVLPLYPKRRWSFELPFRSFFKSGGVKWAGEKSIDRNQLPGRRYCLYSEPKKPTPKCKKSISWREDGLVEIVNGAPAWKNINSDLEVTMALTLQLTAKQVEDDEAVRGFLKMLVDYLDRWQDQPSILVIHVAGATDGIKSLLRSQLGSDSSLSLGLEMTLVAALYSEDKRVASRKGLLNMATDAAPTRWVLSGFELERGMMISHDTAFFANRVAKVYQKIPGNVFIVPQFGMQDETSDWTLSALWEAKKANSLLSFQQIDADDCSVDEEGPDGSNDTFGSATDLWWKLTEPLTKNGALQTEVMIEQHLIALETLQLSVVSLLTEPQHYNLYSMDAAPVILTDNLGPRDGMLTSEIAREVEEFGGRQCYNGLRLTQLAGFGYSINVLAGAYVASTASTRETASAHYSSDVVGTSRCHGCFIFDEDHDDVLEAISRDERHRPAKAALLWDFIDSLSEKESLHIK